MKRRRLARQWNRVGGHQEPRCSGTRATNGSAATNSAPTREYSQAWVRPASSEPARIAVTIEIVTIVPIDMDIVRSAARVEACSGASCTTTQVPNASQVANPVANFPVDKNGVIVEMAPVSNNGSGSGSGTLVFGIGTQPNNPLAAAQTFTTDAAGDLNSTFNGSNLVSFFDSGSNAYFFADSSLPPCGSNFSGFYCPTSGVTRTVNVVGLNGASATANVGILSAATLFSNGNNFAFNDLAGQVGVPNSFDIGLPFFYGRYIYFGIDQTALGGQAPFVAY